MTVRELRDKYIRFFESKGHRRFPAASLIPYDVTGRLDESLLFNGAGMIQFKPYFRGVARPDHPRLVNCQPCVRTNDIDEVGDDTHLSFFEMLGNFSFGDYFKREAIAFSWEFLTSPEWLALDPRRLSVTIFEDDDEAYAEWASWMGPAGIDPATRIVRLNEETNFWPAGAFSNGPPGPCGPNSEMFYWVSPEPPPEGPYSNEDWRRDDAAGNWVEIWNDVFIQFEWMGRPRPDGKGYIKEGIPELPFRSIDTGMGLERTALVLGGYRSVFDTDAFAPIFAKLHALGAPSALEAGADSKVVRANRIVADHLRTSSLCIAEGILPGNTGRGYVLRRLIRRAILQGQRVLGFHQPFLHEAYEGVLAAMGEAYPYFIDRRDAIVDCFQTEEILFRRTLVHGLGLLEEQIGELRAKGIKVYRGDAAFRLYDTFGFPLEITREILSEQGFELDEAGYEAALAEAQVRSRGAQERESVYGGVTGAEELALVDASPSTEFLGYESTEANARIERVRLGERILVALNRTPFYAQSGGQTGDTGLLIFEDGTEVRVSDTTKSGGLFWHELAGALSDSAGLLGRKVLAKVDSARRDRIRRNHTATHLLQASLRRILGPHVAQAGSYVGPDNLRFDFAHGRAMSPAEIHEAERLVNWETLANLDVITYVDLPIDEARAKGAMALFGEKYGDRVRMVEVGDFSRELCGGIHVRTTGQIGLFKITSESSAASGVRRIEAITGEAAYDWVVDETRKVAEASSLLKATPKDLVPAVERAIETAKEERKKRERAEMAAMRGTSVQARASVASASTPDLMIHTAKGNIVLEVKNFGNVDPKLAATAVDDLASRGLNLVVLAALVTDGKPQFICKVGPEAVKAGAHAGNIVREVAKVAEGGGGGRPEFATAGGKNPEKLEEALAAAERILREAVGL